MLRHLQVFNQKTGSVRKALKSLAEFQYVDAPHEALQQDVDASAYGAGNNSNSQRRAWWTWQVRSSVTVLLKLGISVGAVQKQVSRCSVCSQKTVRAARLDHESDT